MSLEEYKQEVFNYFIKLEMSKEEANFYMKRSEEDIEMAYYKNWKVAEVALPILLNYL